MEKLNQVMLYVDDQAKSVEFWTNILGFVVVSEEEMAEGFKAVEVAPKNDVETSISIIEKEFMKKYSPEISVTTPSLMFKEKELDALYKK